MTDGKMAAGKLEPAKPHLTNWSARNKELVRRQQKATKEAYASAVVANNDVLGVGRHRSFLQKKKKKHEKRMSKKICVGCFVFVL